MTDREDIWDFSKQDAYGRYKVPEGPKFFDFWRPLRWIVWSFMWLCWRFTCVTETKWDGTRDKKWGQDIDHGMDWLFPGMVLLVVSLVSGMTVGVLFGSSAGVLALGVVIVVSIIVSFCVRAMFKLNDPEARMHWSNKLLK